MMSLLALLFSCCTQLVIDVYSYLKKAIQAFVEDVSVEATILANRDLFVVNEDLPLLETDKAEIFHHVVAKLLYVA